MRAIMEEKKRLEEEARLREEEDRKRIEEEDRLAEEEARKKEEEKQRKKEKEKVCFLVIYPLSDPQQFTRRNESWPKKKVDS